VPYLFTSLKIAIAIALTGAIVGELPTGAVAGIGARLLVGSYNGLTMMIWSALVAGSVMAATCWSGSSALPSARRSPAWGCAHEAGCAIFWLRRCWALPILAVWEVACRAIPIPQVLLPAPSVIGAKHRLGIPLLAYDFLKTVIQAVIPGWIIGCAAGLAVALLCDRFDFLKRGLLPLGNFFSVLPLVGVAPIMVMWFGTGVAPNIAVVVIMTFFPMLVNALAGLQASSHLERDLMRSYNASWGQALLSPAPARRHALHFQCPQDQFDTGDDWCHRGRVFRHAHRGHGLSHADGIWQHEPRLWSGPKSPWPRWLDRFSMHCWFWPNGRMTFWHPSYRDVGR
jgi:ABC-type nitrate/sulfonate/bicarbonate transport system permease component